MNFRIKLIIVVLFYTTISIKFILTTSNKTLCQNHYDESTTCNCSYDEEESTLIIQCDLYLEQNNNLFPDFKAEEVIAINVFTKWPYIPESFNNTVYLHLEFNKIESINELNSLNNLFYLNVSHNLITRINPEICKLKNLYALDLSYNLIQKLDMQDFMCGNGSDLNDFMSNLKFLSLSNNKIKNLFNFDMFFIGMYWLTNFYINDNLINYIIIDDISDKTSKNLNGLDKLFHKNDSIKSKFEKGIYGVFFRSLNFSNNPIELVRFNFGIIFNSLVKVASIENHLYMKFSSLQLAPLNCDFNFFNDIKFLLNEFLFDKKYFVLDDIFLTYCKNFKNQSLTDYIYEKNFNTSSCMNYSMVFEDENNNNNKNNNSAKNTIEIYKNMIFIAVKIIILKYVI
jgi:Leucine-rich repeat (LRR) protein